MGKRMKNPSLPDFARIAHNMNFGCRVCTEFSIAELYQCHKGQIICKGCHTTVGKCLYCPYSQPAAHCGTLRTMVHLSPIPNPQCLEVSVLLLLLDRGTTQL